ncbi:MAG: hypothetical protein OER90_16360 [Gemmatimonadota bacterium]|nr:hypothetical protein [Gemmatimonadota bacterium]
MRTYALLLAAAALVACGDSEPASDQAAQQPTATPSWVGTVARVANAVERTPAAADSILAANDMTRMALDSLLYVIAADPALTAAYEAVRTK